MHDIKIVWVNGCFDVLHIGHVRLLEYAKSLGGKVVVGIDSDSRIKERKGIERPINNFFDRADFLYSLKSVDLVQIFYTDNDLKIIIQQLEPDYFVIGKEYENKEIIGKEFAKEIKYFDMIEGHSSTNIINKLK